MKHFEKKNFRHSFLLMGNKVRSLLISRNNNEIIFKFISSFHYVQSSTHKDQLQNQQGYTQQHYDKTGRTEEVKEIEKNG
jgi:hypothetical protein